MNVIILAGGLGTRLSEYTESIPKPMVPIGGRPMLWHVMNTYARYDHKDFYVALGFRGELDRPPIVVPPTVLVQRPPEAWGEGR